MANWETLFEGTVAAENDEINQVFGGNNCYLERVYPNIGDTMRVTFDGVAYEEVASGKRQKTTNSNYYGIACVGNPYLSVTDTPSLDTGEPYALYKGAGYGILYLPDTGTHTVKIERQTAASIDHTAMVQGWIVGKRLAAMRGKK